MRCDSRVRSLRSLASVILSSISKRRKSNSPIIPRACSAKSMKWTHTCPSCTLGGNVLYSCSSASKSPPSRRSINPVHS
ncbi:unnamed protein product [Meloidogyne enterolobii]|uniref:Uncharacterized protein n=2 Tax=Meloidogyne enterolobii TaxID=390850 RepID=A0ACB0Y3H6_MELEN